MKRKWIVAALIVLMSTQVLASDATERAYLTQILNQLQAIKPLIVSAAREQPATNRYQFHYVAFKDANGKNHHGLLDDINEMEKGLLDKLEKMPREPHSFQPIKGDYMDHLHQGGPT